MTSDLIDSVLDNWWYYSVELRPGVLAKGYIPPTLPMLPRMILRDVDLDGQDCLDVGCMEGLMPVLMRRKGAAKVLGIDAIPHCERKIAAVKQAYGIDFDFREVGLMYELSRKLSDQGGFDLINLSGVNYHVHSPMHCLAGLRPLLKKNGLMIIGTNVVDRGGYSMDFNARGRLQAEANTFWYHSVPMMEYLARYFQLIPIDCLYYPNSPVNPWTFVPGMDLGYLVMICRAVDEDQIVDDDAWAKQSRAISWEFQNLCDRKMMDGQPASNIAYRAARAPAPSAQGINLLQTIREPAHRMPVADDPRDTHLLMLADHS